MDQEFYEKRLTAMEESNLKIRAERDAAERNLACIADQLNTWARETNQREVTDYLGPCVLRDALKELSGYANQKRYEAEAEADEQRHNADLSWGCIEEVREVLDHFGKLCKPEATDEGTAPMFYREWMLVILQRFQQEADSERRQREALQLQLDCLNAAMKEGEEAAKELKKPMSQVQAIGESAPQTWDDYERGCLATYGGGHHTDGHLEAFQHGMSTVFNLLRNEFPPAQEIKALQAERDAAERNLACIADMLNTWARELNQREVTDYLGPCVLRDALKELSGYANKKRYEAESRLARWPEAVAKLRCLVKPDSQWSECLDFLVEEVERLKEEKRE